MRRRNFLGLAGIGSINPLELLSLDARCLDLNNCGAPEARRSDLYVEFSESYIYNFIWTPSADPQVFLDERVQMSSHGDFYLDRITFGDTPQGLSLRFVYPNGRFSANRRILAGNYAGRGNDALTFLDPMVIPAGLWVGLEIDVTAGASPEQFSIALDGRTRYYLMPPEGASALTRSGPRAF